MGHSQELYIFQENFQNKLQDHMYSQLFAVIKLIFQCECHTKRI